MNFKISAFTIIIMNMVILSTLTYFPSAEAEDFGDIQLSGSDTLTVSGISTCNNLTIRDDATLIVESGYLQVFGLVRMEDNARFFVIRGTVRVRPSALNDSTMVIHVKDSAMINVKDSSNFVLDPQPTATNVSYMLLEDQSSFYVIDSTFSGDQPAIIHQSLEIASVTAGVYLLSGYATWHMVNSEITGRVKVEGGELTGRWFWCSLHQRSSLTVENCDMELLGASSGYTMLKPVSGTTTLRNTRLLAGTMECEVTSEIHMENCTFASRVDFKDQTVAYISNSTFERDVTVGSALALVEVDRAPETEVHIEGSTLKNYMRCAGNSTTDIGHTSLDRLSASENATVTAANSTFSGFLSVMDFSTVKIQDVGVESMVVEDTALIQVEECGHIVNVTFYGSGEGIDEEAAVFSETQISKMTLNANFSAALSLNRVTLGNLSFYDEVNATFECVGSTVENIRHRRYGRNVTLSFIDVDSTLPDFDGINRNITVKVFHRLTVLVTLNGEGIETGVVVHDDLQGEWRGDTASGSIGFDLPYRFILDTTDSITEDYTVKAEYLGFSETKNIILSSSKNVSFRWSDHEPPIITDISFAPGQWNMGKDITVSTAVTDQGVISISRVSLYYRVDGGDRKEVKMFRVGDNRYEAMIPKQDKTCEITFYISAADGAGNAVNTPEESINVGEKERLLYISGVFVLAALIVVFAGRTIIIRRKIKEYKNKYEFKRSRK
ncbi:MAG: hypothetical protein JSW28_05110 [Thermoplasmata archaeon]|nr:MAG: hypothetical protein JSW28_05110 [Thermoplasmata archaeon]